MGQPPWNGEDVGCEDQRSSRGPLESVQHGQEAYMGRQLQGPSCRDLQEPRGSWGPRWHRGGPGGQSQVGSAGGDGALQGLQVPR